MRYSIVPARAEELSALAAVERAAATLLADHVPPAELAATVPLADLVEAQAAERLWVALADEQPVGFALVVLLANGDPQLAELSVDPQHGRQGLGTALVGAATDWAARHGYTEITLTTFSDLAWNRPFYERLGFEVIPAESLNAELKSILEQQAARGFDPSRRVAMRLRLSAGNYGQR